MRDLSLRTLCPGLGHGSGDGSSLVTPLVQSTTFLRDGVGSDAPHQYSRVSNPTVAALERALGELERAHPAACFASGLAAETALFLSLLSAGDHLVCGRSVYGGTTRLLERVLAGLGVASTRVDTTDPDAVRRAVRPETRLVFVETPANPTLELTDVRACAEIAHRAGALLAVDNTFLTPVLQQPLDLGADVSVYSTTKLMEGHSVALGGALVSRDEDLLERFRFLRKCTGAIQTPFHAWLTLNGLRTLPLRAREQSRTAARIAEWLASGRPGIDAVFYPGLEGNALAAAQHPEGDGAVVSFVVSGGLEGARAFLARLEVATLVEHVGSVETLVTHPATMTHADVDPAERAAVRIDDGLIRLSVGLESPEDLLDDLSRGLGAVLAAREEAACPAGPSS
jgi:cystathionine beta-lyase/cystathionine gamma-synthase